MAKPTSPTEIVNLALRLLKTDPVLSIDPPDDDSKEAEAGAAWYDQARREVLEDHPWNFASKRASIASDADAPEFEYTARYELPADFIRLNRIGENWDDPEQDYEIEGDYILANVDTPLMLVYVWDIETVSKFSAKFVHALACRLATLMAYELTGNASLVDVMSTEYDKALTSAESVDGQNRPTRRIQRSKLREARGNMARGRNWRTWGPD